MVRRQLNIRVACGAYQVGERHLISNQESYDVIVVGYEPVDNSKI